MIRILWVKGGLLLVEFHFGGVEGLEGEELVLVVGEEEGKGGFEGGDAGDEEGEGEERCILGWVVGVD